MSAWGKCDACHQKPPMHSVYMGGKLLGYCCQCYVGAGNPPARWHPECMAATTPEIRRDVETRESDIFGRSAPTQKLRGGQASHLFMDDGCFYELHDQMFLTPWKRRATYRFYLLVVGLMTGGAFLAWAFVKLMERLFN